MAIQTPTKMLVNNFKYTQAQKGWLYALYREFIKYFFITLQMIFSSKDLRVLLEFFRMALSTIPRDRRDIHLLFNIGKYFVQNLI